MECRGRCGAREGALHADHDALGQLGECLLREVAIDEVQRHLVGADALLDELLDDLHRLLEADDCDRARLARLELADLGAELSGLRVVDDLLAHRATACGEVGIECIGKAGAVGIIKGEDAGLLDTRVEHERAEDRTLEEIGRRVAEVQTIVVVVRQGRRSVRRREVNNACARDLVDDGERDARGRCADDRGNACSDVAICGLRCDVGARVA